MPLNNFPTAELRDQYGNPFDSFDATEALPALDNTNRPIQLRAEPIRVFVDNSTDEPLTEGGYIRVKATDLNGDESAEFIASTSRLAGDGYGWVSTYSKSGSVETYGANIPCVVTDETPTISEPVGTLLYFTPTAGVWPAGNIVVTLEKALPGIEVEGEGGGGDA